MPLSFDHSAHSAVVQPYWEKDEGGGPRDSTESVALRGAVTGTAAEDGTVTGLDSPAELPRPQLRLVLASRPFSCIASAGAAVAFSRPNNFVPAT